MNEEASEDRNEEVEELRAILTEPDPIDPWTVGRIRARVLRRISEDEIPSWEGRFVVSLTGLLMSLGLLVATAPVPSADAVEVGTYEGRVVLWILVIWAFAFLAYPWALRGFGDESAVLEANHLE